MYNHHFCLLFKALRGEAWTFNSKAICFSNDKLIGHGGPDDFVSWAELNFGFEEYRPLPLYATLTDKAYNEHLCQQKV